MTGQTVRIAIGARSAAFALAAELRRRFDATFDLAVNAAAEGWIVEVPTPIWLTPGVPVLIAGYGGQRLP